MRIINTEETDPKTLTAFEREMWYNSHDVLATHEIMGILLGELDETTAATYEFSKRLQAPVLEMRCRGVLVNLQRRNQVIDQFAEVLDTLETALERIVVEGVGMDEFNWRAHAHVKRLFYDYLQIPPIYYQGKLTSDRKARDRLMQYTIARPFVRYLNHIADLGKKIGVLKAAVDSDGRIRTSYNIGGTSTGRFSSSSSEFGTGGNLQNIEESLRSMFIADPGMKFAKFDAKSGESFIVGAIEWNLFGDSKYLEACETGDPHTASAKLCWPELPWTGDLKADKEIAEQPFYRHHTYRNTTKKAGHASNYNGKAATIAGMHAMPESMVEMFQYKYFETFPAHRRWHSWVENEIFKRGCLTSLMGRKRYFLGRRDDPKTLREAIAYDPQESLCRIVNEGMMSAWRARDALVMMHDHDALTFMYPEKKEDEVIPKILRQLEVPVQLRGGRTLRIPYDCEVGWNKGHVGKDNPDGLRPYFPRDGGRKRTPTPDFFDRPGRL